MTRLPENIKATFCNTIKGTISVDEFEQWLYVDKELEKYLTPDDYYDLISLNFKKSDAEYELWDLLKKHIGFGAFETYNLLGLLYEARKKNEELPYILMEFSELYYKGYYFLEDFLVFSISIEIPRINNEMDTWKDLSLEQQKELLDSFLPQLEESIEEVIHWIETKKIILTGKQDGLEGYAYEDLRTEAERKSNVTVLQSEYSVRQQKHKKWWQFWK